jgi:hypothetical protein
VALWTEIPAFLLGLVTLGVTTNAFARRRTRTLKELRSQAELLALLPDGPGRSELARHLDEATAGLVRELEAPRARSGIPALALVSTAFLGALVWIGGASTAVVWDDRPDWIRSLSLTGLVLTALATSAMAILNRRTVDGGTRHQPTAAR